MTTRLFPENYWALILGASSGFGAATARELARRGMNIIGIHFDRAAGMPAVEQLVRDIEAHDVRALFFNINASDPAKRKEVFDTVEEEFSAKRGDTIRVLFHSLAFGTLKPYIADRAQKMMTQANMEMTIDVMANSLVYWTQEMILRSMMQRGGRIFMMTSSGGHVVLPNYGAVSAAKAAGESHIRQLAMELGPMGITANAILAGVTNTPALRKIPGAMRMLEIAIKKNPAMRATTPEDVGNAVALFAQDEAGFISGNIIGVDGGEDVVNYMGQKNPYELESEDGK